MSSFYTPGKKLLLFILIAFCCHNSIYATVTILKASGGTNLPADRAANATSPLYTTLGNVRFTEALVTDFSVGSGVTLTLAPPTGWTFNTAAAVTATATNGRDITSPSVTSITSTLITVQFTVGGITKLDVLTVAGIQVRATEGANIPAAVADIVRGGTAVISGCVAGASLSTVSQIAGTPTNLIVTMTGQTFTDATTFAASGNSGTITAKTVGSSCIIAGIRAVDQFLNVV